MTQFSSSKKKGLSNGSINKTNPPVNRGVELMLQGGKRKKKKQVLLKLAGMRPLPSILAVARRNRRSTRFFHFLRSAYRPRSDSVIQDAENGYSLYPLRSQVQRPVSRAEAPTPKAEREPKPGRAGGAISAPSERATLPDCSYILKQF